MTTRKTSLILFLSLCSLLSFSQTITKAGLMTLRDPYASTYAKENIFRPLPGGKTLISGYLPSYEFTYAGYDSRQDTICSSSFICNNFVALISENNELIWIKYTNGAFSDIAFDSKKNIILSGQYKSILTTSNGDTVPLLSNNTNHYGNVFVMKLDSLGNTKWIKTTDNEAYGQAEPDAKYLRIDSDDNIYLAGHYDYFIRFDSTYSFNRISPYIGSVPFLAKIDSSGNYKWIRDWGEESGLESGLEIDSCRVNMFVEFGALQNYTRLRKYEFNGKLVDYKIYQSIGNYGNNTVKVKDSVILMTNTFGQPPPSVNIYNIQGTLLKKISVTGLGFGLLAFTTANNIYFCGECLFDSCFLGTTKINKGIAFGVMNTSGDIIKLKNIQRTYYLRDNVLTPNGSFYFVSSITSNINPYDYFSIDTITFNGLSYYDSRSGVNSGIHYRLYTRFDVSDSAYIDKRTCFFSPPKDTCLDRQGLSKCNLVTSIMSPQTVNDITINPNPASDLVRVTIKEANTPKKYTLLFYNQLGILKMQKIVNAGSNLIDVSNLPNGYYLIHIVADNRRYKEVQKLIISR
jgi:hypothetical protein